MSHPTRYAFAATFLALIWTSSVSGSGPAIAPANRFAPNSAQGNVATSPMVSAASHQAVATQAPAAKIVHITVDVLSNRHPISPYVYGGAYPKDAATITDSG